MRPDPQSTGSSSGPDQSGVARAGRGFVLVFVGALMFFAFVIGSELLGSVGQASLSFLFASAALVYLWFRLDPSTRRRLTVQVRHVVRPSSRR
jgi:Flp pilus assembly protein TadB